MASKKSIQELADEIRDFVNNSRKNYELRQNMANFSQLASALDTIEDSDEAITAFKTIEVGDHEGKLYLTIYGLLQAFFLQQDAVEHLCEALDVQDRLKNYPKLMEIREIRHISVGHPTKKDKPKPTTYHVISRITMSKQGFQLITYDGAGGSTFQDISIPDLIANQLKFISEMLAKIIDKLEADEKAYKEKFCMEKLVNKFPDTIGYAFENVGRGLHGDPRGKWGTEHIKTAAHNFLDAVKRRDMEAFTQLQDQFKYIDHAITQIERIFDAVENGTSQPNDENDGYIYLAFLQHQIDELREYAKQIDEEYAS